VASEIVARENGQGGGGRLLVGLLLVVSAVVYVAGFVHLRADFPNGSPWSDWSKMTDEGWYGGGAIHHFVQGSWYLPESFNPAVAMPVWPVMLAGWFSVTGVSMVAARVLTMLLYGVSLGLLYRVVRLAVPGGRVLAALAVLLVVMNPFCYAFDRLAVLEPVTVFWMMVALWLASDAEAGEPWRLGVLGVVVGLLVLTKVTGVALVPAVVYLVWAKLGRGRRGVGGVMVAGGVAGLIWVCYQRFFVDRHYLADYRLLFSINAYRVHLSIVPRMAWVTMRDGMWIQPGLWVLAMVFVVLSVVWLRELWRVPLFGAAVLAIFGHLAYVGYHTNFQPRYYLVIAMPTVMVIVLGMDAVRARGWGWVRLGVRGAVAVAVVIMAVQTWEYAAHPQYSFLEAAQSVAAVVRADGGGPLLSDSGDDITLMTGLPAVAEAYQVHGLDALLERYKPGWYAAWPGWEDAAIKAVGERYRLDEVARYRVFDDPRRQTLVLYKLSPR
jgi:4-amino-4-deoxy-L-arabinose transferase-like glycosyltransferase